MNEDTAVRSLGHTWSGAHCLPTFTMKFKKQDGSAYIEKFVVWLHLSNEDFDFIYDPLQDGDKVQLNTFPFEMEETDEGKVNYDPQAWRIEPKLHDGSSLGREEVETGKEIPVMVSLFYGGPDESRGAQIGHSKSFTCLVAPGLPESLELIPSGNNHDRNGVITVTNGSSLEGVQLAFFDAWGNRTGPGAGRVWTVTDGQGFETEATTAGIARLDGEYTPPPPPLSTHTHTRTHAHVHTQTSAQSFLLYTLPLTHPPTHYLLTRPLSSTRLHYRFGRYHTSSGPQRRETLRDVLL